MAQLHFLRRKIRHKSKKIIGRGGKRGTYSGAGIKGQKSRAGRKMRPELRDIIKKLPKKRGYRTPSLKSKLAVLNIKDIETALSQIDAAEAENRVTINPQVLDRLGLIRREKGRFPEVKILGTGEVTKKLVVSGCKVSRSAREKIVSQGGHVAE